jgi:DNA-binding transcriptional LysR family regulator
MPIAPRLYPESMNVGVRHLRAFVVIARRGNITRAAEDLHLTQPAVTRMLQQLEHHLGLKLVERSTRQLRLTAAGEAYLPRAEHALGQLEALLDPGRVERGPLRVGYAWGAFGAATATILTHWQQSHPDVVVQMLRVDARDAGLGAGAVDIGIVRDFPPHRGIKRQLVTRETRYAAIPADHLLARAGTLNLVDLTEETIVVNAVSGTTSVELWPFDIRPTRTIEVGNTDDWVLAIAAGRGVGISGAATRESYTSAGMRFVPVLDAPPIRLELVWREPPHPATAEFVATACAAINGDPVIDPPRP